MIEVQVVRRAALPLLLVACAAAGAGCKKDNQSLIVAQLKLAADDPRAADLVSVTLTATPGPTRTYALTGGLSVTGTADFGIYLPGDITGDVSIVAEAVPSSGCVGFRGDNSVTLAAAGATKTVTITMMAKNVCPSDAGGTGGTTGAGGSSAGSGGSGGSTGGAGGSTGGAGAGIGGSSAGTGGSVAGTGGSSTGTGGNAGRGGAGGSAGGSTGAGGMAGYPAIANCRTFRHAAGAGCTDTYVNAVAISPNGQMVASAGDDGRVKIWTFDGVQLAATSTVLTGFAGNGVAFSPDGTRLAYTAGATVKTYTVAGWAAGPTLLGDGSNNDLTGVAFTPDGQRIVSADLIGSAGGDVFVHDLGGSTLPALMAHVATQPAQGQLAVSPRAASDGSVGVAVGTYGGKIAVLTLGANALSAPVVLSASSSSGAVFAVGFSSDGSLLAAGDDSGVVQFWNYPLSGTAPTGSNLSFAGGDTINSLAFSPNGMYVAVGGAFFNKQLSIYSFSTRMEIDRVTPAGDVNALVFSPSGGAIIAGLDECDVIVCN